MWRASPLTDGAAWDAGWTANIAVNLTAATDLTAGDTELAAHAASLPMGEITPAEVVAFLASGRSAHATGTTIDICGADYVR